MTHVMVFGTFDHLHPGHVFFLTEAKKLGDRLTAVVARDRTVTTVKSHAAFQNEHERLAAVEDTRIADVVRLGSLGDKFAVIRELSPDIIALGYDQNSYSEPLPKLFPEIKIVRLGAFIPEKYKTSKMHPLP